MPVDASSQRGRHLFADDTQLFISFKSSELASNQMKLNSEKTGLLLINSRYCKVVSSKFTLDTAVRNIVLY